MDKNEELCMKGNALERTTLREFETLRISPFTEIKVKGGRIYSGLSASFMTDQEAGANGC